MNSFDPFHYIDAITKDLANHALKVEYGNYLLDNGFQWRGSFVHWLGLTHRYPYKDYEGRLYFWSDHLHYDSPNRPHTLPYELYRLCRDNLHKRMPCWHTWDKLEQDCAKEWKRQLADWPAPLRFLGLDEWVPDYNALPEYDGTSERMKRYLGGVR